MPSKTLFPNGKFQELHLISSNLDTDLNHFICLRHSEGSESRLVTPNSILEVSEEYLFASRETKIEERKPKEHRHIKVFGKILGYLLAVTLISVASLSYTGHMKVRVVLTGSMEPKINRGDLIITIPVSEKAPKKGDVVAYIGRRFDGSQVGIFSHRIIGGDAKTGFIVKGDANPSPDVQRPKLKDITGIVIFVIPFLGRLLAPKTLFVLIPVGFGLWFIWDALKNE